MHVKLLSETHGKPRFLPTSLIFFNAMKKFVTPSHFNVNGQHRICLIVGKFKQVW